ncbi:MAG: hypothetical protein IPO29_10540 [Anaerolineae bacterium]|nr:hypothetical protein [Anaerolineae bacterium]
MPLLVAGLEQASQLAEAMMARGYASATRLRRRDLALIVAGLILAALGGGAQLTQGGFGGLAMMCLGLAVFLGGLALSGRAVARTQYRDRGMRPDGLDGAGADSGGVRRRSIWRVRDIGLGSYPTLLMPSFQLGAGLCLLFAAAPAAGARAAAGGRTPGEGASAPRT